ncbi:hypothetical protein S58_36880 [Bradyrhizobium oligotrophicum S58]|uniref:DUF2946 domain-containing protein n=1 Tax=Bradyrhizobium oligotrophicum S58 TaxID=1245469 RepID=M4Z8W5_9BRAD|nr:hypothetical protein [Bradyrhizobium oligotrophicum]BAM89681.1 hypothetical protein S58_36880 [Bradyrhizobium oligotrophicum S58]
MRRIPSHRKHLTGAIACAMAYVLALQVTLAVGLNAWLPPSFAFAFGEICHEQLDGGTRSADRAEVPSGAPATASAAHCPLCLTPAFALLSPPDVPAVMLRRVLGIAFEPTATPRVDSADIHAAHRARAPPARA